MYEGQRCAQRTDTPFLHKAGAAGRERTRSRSSDVCAPPAYHSTTETRSLAAAPLDI